MDGQHHQHKDSTETALNDIIVHLRAHFLSFFIIWIFMEVCLGTPLGSLKSEERRDRNACVKTAAFVPALRSFLWCDSCAMPIALSYIVPTVDDFGKTWE